MRADGGVRPVRGVPVVDRSRQLVAGDALVCGVSAGYVRGLCT